MAGEVLLDAAQVCRRRLAQRGQAVVGEHRFRPASVVRTLLARHEAGCLHAVDEPGETAAADEHRLGELAHPPASARRVELDEHVVPGQRQPVRRLQLVLEHVDQRGVRDEEPPPSLDPVVILLHLCAIASRAGPQPRPPPKRGAPAPRRPCSLRYRFPGGAPTPPSSEAWGPCPTPAATRGLYPAEKRNSCRCNYVGSGTMNRMSEHDAIDLRRADRRPHTKIDWLDSHHSFSFGHHYDPTNVGHGLLLVNNDDIVRAGTGFTTHPHRDMEIVTWVLEGELEHKDSAGHQGLIFPGLAQRMSAGTGIWHSEMNPSRGNDVHCVQ